MKMYVPHLSRSSLTDCIHTEFVGFLTIIFVTINNFFLRIIFQTVCIIRMQIQYATVWYKNWLFFTALYVNNKTHSKEIYPGMTHFSREKGYIVLSCKQWCLSSHP